MNTKLKNNVLKLKKKYEAEGFIILGVFGSYARNQETKNSDIDILYRLDELFYEKYSGWDALGRIEDIKTEIEKFLGLTVDFANKNGLNEIGEKYILPEVAYVL
jgi:uncharacterized protein